MRPLNHPEYQPLDTHTYNFFKPHDDKELQEKIWGLTKPENITKTIDEVDEKGNPTGKKIDVVNQVLDPVQRKNALYGVSSFYNTHTGTKNMIDNLIQNPSTKSQLDNLYSDLHPELWKKDNKGQWKTKTNVSEYKNPNIEKLRLQQKNIRTDYLKPISSKKKNIYNEFKIL